MARVIAFDTRSRYESWVKRYPEFRHHAAVSLSAPLTGLGEEDRRAFLSDYIDMVGQLSAYNHSLLWWATDIASKNRFFSPLPPYLERFFKLFAVLEKSEAEVVIFTDVPWQITGSVRQALRLKKIPYCWQGKGGKLYGEMVKEFLTRTLRILRHIFYIFPRISGAKRLFAPSISPAASDLRPAYVIKTFAARRSFSAQGQYRDLFFGGLPDFIFKGRRVIILADIMDEFAATLKLIGEHGKGVIYPLEAFLKAADVWRASVLMLLYAIRVPRSLSFGSFNVSDMIHKICLTRGSKIQPQHFYQYFMMKRFLKKFKAREFAFTCEFNPWEKMCLMAIKEDSPSTKTFGYQHTVVPQASVNMFTSRFEQGLVPRPDILVTVGEKPRDIIHRYETCAASLVKVGCGLRFEYLFGQAQGPRTRRGHVLLAVEGLPQAVHMINYVLGQWPSCAPYHLRIRTHPVLPLSKLQRTLIRDPAGMERVEVSKGRPLPQDLEWADVVVYWGSTVALEALGMGRPVVHFDNGSVLSYDPLFELNDFKWKVDQASDLSQVLGAISALSDQEFNSRRKAAQDYIAAYFHPITPEAMSCFLG